jgi:hypothetical protein
MTDPSHKDLIPNVERLMSRTDITYDPADAVALRDALPVQSRMSLHFFTTAGHRAFGAAGPARIGRYDVFHACDPITGNSQVEITPVSEDEKTTFRIEFRKGRPTEFGFFRTRPLSFSFFTLPINIGIPSWSVWKTPKVPEPAAQQTDEAVP